MMAPYAEPTTNKGSFRFGSQLHFLQDLTTALRPGGRSELSSWVVVWMVREQWAQWVGRQAGAALRYLTASLAPDQFHRSPFITSPTSEGEACA